MRGRSILTGTAACLLLLGGLDDVTRADPPDPASRNPSRAARAREAFLREHRAAMAEARESITGTRAYRPDELVRFGFSPAGRLIGTLTEEGHRVMNSASSVTAADGGWMALDHLSGDELIPGRRGDPTAFRFRYGALDEASFRWTFIEIFATANITMFTVNVDSPRDLVVSELVERVGDPNDPADLPAASMSIQLTVTRIRDADDARADAEEGLSGIDGDSAAHLFLDAPADAHTIFADGLRRLHAMPLLAGGLTDAQVRQVCMGDAAPTARSMAQIARIVDDVRARGEAGVPDAIVALRTLEPAALGALARGAREGWSPELCLNVDVALAGLLPMSEFDAQRVRASPQRLIDLLYSSDEPARRGALARIERLAGRSVRIDLAGDPYAMPDQIEALRALFEDAPLE